MITFPADSYMRALAEATYTVLYLEGLIRYDLYRLNPPPPDLDIWQIARDTMGSLSRKIGKHSSVESDPQKQKWLKACDEALDELTSMRNAMIHSFPATIDGTQVLNRWTARTATQPQEAFPITEQGLNDLRERAYSHITKINKVRLPEPFPPTPSP